MATLRRYATYSVRVQLRNGTGDTPLQRVLADGPVQVAEVSNIARAEGITSKMLRNARDRLGVVYRTDSKSYELPTTMYVP